MAAYCLLPTAGCLFAASGRYEVREVKPHVFVWIPEDILDQEGDPQFNRAGTAGFIVTRDSVVVVDTTNGPFHARELLFEVRQRTELPVKYVIDTNAQGDYVMGNEVFLDQQASIISSAAVQAAIGQYQKNLNARLAGDFRLQARLRGFHLSLPNQTFDSEMSLNIGGEGITLLNLGSRGLSGGTVVYLPRSKILFLGDLFQNKFIPRVGSTDVRAWVETLQRVESWDVDQYVPGHGPPGDKKEVAEFRHFLEWLSSAVESRIRQGRSLAQIKNELVPFENYPWRARELAPEAVEAVYQQLVGAQHAPPSAEKSGDPQAAHP